MKILGLSSNYHDASAALVVDGKLIAAAAEERFTLQKHDPNFPVLAAEFCLKRAGLSAEELDCIAYHENPNEKFSRTLSSSFARFPFSLPTFLKSMREAITGGFWVRNRISAALDVHPNKIIYVPHHCSHAAHSFLTSPFDEAAIMTLDAAGEWMCSGFFTGHRRQKKILPVGIVPFPHSLGLVYSAFTGFLGFKVNDGECSTMALAAFGQPRFAAEIRKIIRLTGDGGYEIDVSYFDFTRDDSLPITRKFTGIFGEPRAHSEVLPFDCLKDPAAQPAVPTEVQRYADIAASIQLVLEETILSLAASLRSSTGLPKLCLSGGVALNCVAVGKLADSGIFDELYVPPDPGDGGGAAGAALFQHFRAAGSGEPDQDFSPYQGESYDEEDVLAILPLLPSAGHVKVAVKRDFDAAVVFAAEALAGGKIVGWLQDRFEAGPRALGNRSILADPSNVATARRISARVKRRASFRPYACSVASDELERVFGRRKSAHSLAARWMQSSSEVDGSVRAQLRAAIHVDGTTRPHVCTEELNPRLHRLLGEFKARKGLGALLNTSFNESGMPIVASPVNALLMFLRTDMDVLVLNGTVLVKEEI